MNADAGLPIDGLILAGGRSRRMGGGRKALTELAGRPLLQHVIDTLAPQVCELALSVDEGSAALADFGLPQLPDPHPGHRGPLGGVLSGLRYFAPRRGWLLVVPCDAPFLPPDLANRLSTCAQHAAAAAAVIVETGEWQPTFSIWRHDLLSRLVQAVEQGGEAGLKRLLRALGAAECAWTPADDDAPSPFFNVNDPAALALAGRWVDLRVAVDQQA